MITAQEALARIAAKTRPLEALGVPLAEAAGCVLAAPAIARVTHPPAVMSAMDGYAIARPEPCKEGLVFDVIGEAPAGAPFDGSVAPGEAVRLFTGSVIPSGADHVVVQEEMSRQSDRATLTAPQPVSRNIRAAGGDFSRGDPLLPPGHLVSPIDLAYLASANLPMVTAHRRPVVAFFANGDELLAPGTVPLPGQVISSIPEALSAMITAWGALPHFLGTALDTEADVDVMFDRAATAGADVVVPIGGASVGDYDVVKRCGKARFDLAFDQVAVRPGKPVWFGTSDAGAILGLPGNPASALACAILFLRPLLHGLTGRDPIAANPLRIARLSVPLGTGAAREHYMRALAKLGPDGTLTVAAQTQQDTGLLGPFSASNALLRRPAKAPAASVGEAAQIILFGPLP